MSEQKQAMPPERIWVQWPNVNGCGLAFNAPANPRNKSDDRFEKRTAYILAALEVVPIAADPAVVALVEAAVAAERALWARAVKAYFDATAVEDVEKYVAAHRAAAIRKGQTP